jgi:hypothetical protein
MPAINESCIYRSMAGEPWEATITAIGPEGFVSVSLTGPFLKEPFALTAVRWYDDPDEPRSGARPRRAGAQQGDLVAGEASGMAEKQENAPKAICGRL